MLDVGTKAPEFTLPDSILAYLKIPGALFALLISIHSASPT